MNTPHWSGSAVCAQTDPDLWNPVKGSSAPEARRICQDCPSKTECLDEAMRLELGMDIRERNGIWGGLGPGGRVALEPAWLAERSAA